MTARNVKWFNPTKGYGFIQPQGGGQNVFVPISAVERAGLTTLTKRAEAAEPSAAKLTANALSVRERLLLLCTASGTDATRAGIIGENNTTAMMAKGLVRRDPHGRLTLTERGREVLWVLLHE
jgi:cold shock CspA family protein